MSYLSVLADKGLLNSEDLAALEEEMVIAPEKIEDGLVARGVSAEQVLRAKGGYFGLPVRSISNEKIPDEILKYIPQESARHYRVLPLALADGVLEVGIVDPENFEARDAISFLASKNHVPFKFFLISRDDFDRALRTYEGLTAQVGEALEEYETELGGEEEAISKAAEDVSGAPLPGGEVTTIEEAPVTKIVATILRYAIEGGASDVHIEPTLERVRVRFRVDGILHTSLILPIKVHRAVVARIKVLSNIKLDEKRRPQDGRFSARISGRKVDFRVSSFPASGGEKVVLRILDQERGVKTLEGIGMRDSHLSLVRQALKMPYGMILISGPTGSGKSTTLYAMLQEVDREKLNVVSLEDPVEYHIDGVAQSQVMPEIGFTFASGLRSVLRQDPDVIMVGEIRDRETAQLAIQAALTGHIVFSTLHTNTAAGAIPRLIDMGVDPYLIAPTVVLVVAQRLVRTLCAGAGRAVAIDGSIKLMLEKQFADMPNAHRDRLPLGKEVYEASPTPECASGVRGRTAVFEMFRMTKELERVILETPTESSVYQHVREVQGMLTMKEDAILKSSERIVPFEEVNTL
ncbi:MAG: GspE/PulE family protein [bacterium]|nr:GspE/PulE family protein [bacterium]MDZ4284264.1 GspE/PulE family protein [Patescibacteria group bacterium]